MKNITFLFITLILCSCPRSYEPEGIGQPITATPDGFKIHDNDFYASGNNFDFTKDLLTLHAIFNSTVTANIKFSGLKSGAQRNISIVTDHLDKNTFSWYGEFDPGTKKFFKSGEQVMIQLSFYNSDIILFDTVTIAKANNFMRNPNVIPVALEEDNGFETNIAWPWGVGKGSRVLDDNSPQGDYSLELRGSNSNSTWVTWAAYGDRVTGPYKNPGVDGSFYPLTNNSSNIWFNIYVYGDEKEDTELYVSFLEADRSNKDDEARKGVDDAVQIKLSTDHKGWKLFSFKYSDISFQNYCIEGIDGGGCGDKIKEPHRIKVVAFDLETENKGREVSVKFDYPLFTIGAPFNPVTFRK